MPIKSGCVLCAVAWLVGITNFNSMSSFNFAIKKHGSMKLFEVTCVLDTLYEDKIYEDIVYRIHYIYYILLKI